MLVQCPCNVCIKCHYNQYIYNNNNNNNNRPNVDQTALETISLGFNMGKLRHPLFGSGRDFFIQISSPKYAANRTESIGANRSKSAQHGSKGTRNQLPRL